MAHSSAHWLLYPDLESNHMVSVEGWMATLSMAVRGSPLVEPSVYQASAGIGPSPCYILGRVSGMGTSSNGVVSSVVYVTGPRVTCNSALRGLLVGVPRCCKCACNFANICVWAVPEWGFWKVSCSHSTMGGWVRTVTGRERVMGSTCWRARQAAHNCSGRYTDFQPLSIIGPRNQEGFVYCLASARGPIPIPLGNWKRPIHRVVLVLKLPRTGFVLMRLWLGRRPPAWWTPGPDNTLSHQLIKRTDSLYLIYDSSRNHFCLTQPDNTQVIDRQLRPLHFVVIHCDKGAEPSWRSEKHSEVNMTSSI